MKFFTPIFFTAALLHLILPYVLAQTQNAFPFHHPGGIHTNNNQPVPVIPLRQGSRPGNPITGTPTPVVEWQKCFGSNYGEYAYCVQATADGGYIVAGYSVGADNGDVMGHHGNATVGDIWIVKLDKQGNMEWQKSLGGMDSEQGAFILPTPDGGYVVAGGAGSRDCSFTGVHGALDYYVAKLSGKGDIVWQKVYGGSNDDLASSVALSPDGGYFVAGFTTSNDGDVTGGHGSLDYWIIKIDAIGNLTWQKSLGGSESDVANSIQTTTDGGCIVAGFTGSNNGNITGYHGNTDAWLVKLDKTGSIQWEKTVGGSMSDIANCLQLTKDGGYILTGYTNSADGDVSGNHGAGFDCWVVKLDATGNRLWQNCYGGNSNEVGYNIQQTPDGGYVVAGYTLSADGDINCNAGLFDAMVLKINSSGVLEWLIPLGGTGMEEAYSVQPLADGSFIVAGYTSSQDISGYHTPAANAGDISDYWVIKLSAPVATVPAPQVTINPASATVCAGGKATFSAAVLYAGLNPVYQWTKNGAAVGTNSASYTDANFLTNDLVSCTVTAASVCNNSFLQGTDAVTIKVNSNTISPAIMIAADNMAVCNCSTITIKATVTNGGGSPIYQWKVNGMSTGYTTATMISTNLKAGDVVTCIYTDNATCVAGGSVTSNAITFKGSNGNPPSITISTPADTDTTCTGASVKFTATAVNAGSNPTYQWKINNVNAGTNSRELVNSSIANADIVTCTVTSDPLSSCGVTYNANSNSIVMHTITAANPSVNITASSATICKGSTVTFTAAVTNAGVHPSYQWKINGVNAGTNNQQLTSASFTNGDIVNCTATTDPLYTCALSNQAVSGNIVMTVTNGNLPSVSIDAANNNACAGEAISFTATVQDAGAAPSYQWVLNNTILPNQSALFSSNKLVNGDRLFCVVIPGAGACGATPDSSNTIIAVINDTPTVHITPADTTIVPGNQVLLTPVTSDDVVSFTWAPAAKLINPFSLSALTTILNESTGYTLSVMNDKGCRSIAAATVRIFTKLYMPNAFTPNGDGVNDVFRIAPATSLILKEFSVYDRWGNKVFTTKDIGTGWDGTFNGKKQNTGSYIYFIRSVINNRELSVKGNFILVR